MQPVGFPRISVSPHPRPPVLPSPRVSASLRPRVPASPRPRVPASSFLPPLRKEDRQIIGIQLHPVRGSFGLAGKMLAILGITVKKQITDLVGGQSCLPLRVSKRVAVVANQRLGKQVYSAIEERTLPGPETPREIAAIDLGMENVAGELVLRHVVEGFNRCRRLQEAAATQMGDAPRAKTAL